MKATIEPGSVGGTIKAPPSKSMTQRVYAGALLHKGRTTIYGAGSSDDEVAALNIIQQLGARITGQTEAYIEIESNGVAPVGDTIHCGESGLAARLFIPIASLCGQEITITGEGSLPGRSMQLFDSVLPQLKVAVQSENGFLPMRVKGPLVAADITMDGGESSQYVSGLLFGLCYAQREPVCRITARNLASKPYVAMTLHVLELFGNGTRQEAGNVYTAWQAEPVKEDIAVTVEGDWSGAACLLVAGAIAGDVTVTGLADNHIQADGAIYNILKNAGADISREGDRVRVKRSVMKGFEVDATDCPDLFPALAILGSCSEGESYITGVHRLFNKESNRAQSISEMLENFNVPFSIEDDVLCITGVRRLQGTIIDPHHDHRIVMAAAVGALRASGRVDIADAEAVNKSYPDFFRDLAMITGKQALV
jgi:3-phosphoshikimate 1-carboxyvinyltransferase